MSEMMLLAQKCKSILSAVYHPDGFNLGMNLGRCAGAGVEHHVHLHVVPRWIGDSNFMTVVGESRVLPDDLPATFGKLRPFFLD
jgi:ATP adenylyltransferase